MNPNNQPQAPASAQMSCGGMAAIAFAVLFMLGLIASTLPHDYEIDAKTEVEHRVRMTLKNPDSARFKNESITKKSERRYRVKGIVYATNSFNAVVPTEFDIELEFPDDKHVKFIHAIIEDPDTPEGGIHQYADNGGYSPPESTPGAASLPTGGDTLGSDPGVRKLADALGEARVRSSLSSAEQQPTSSDLSSGSRGGQPVADSDTSTVPLEPVLPPGIEKVAGRLHVRPGTVLPCGHRVRRQDSPSALHVRAECSEGDFWMCEDDDTLGMVWKQAGNAEVPQQWVREQDAHALSQAQIDAAVGVNSAKEEAAVREREKEFRDRTARAAGK